MSVSAKTAALAQKLIERDGPDTPILTLGDNVYYLGNAAEFSACYEPTWGQFKSRTWTTPGNHDYLVPQANDYFDYFGSAAGADRSGYYSKSRNGWTVISLNSNVSTNSGSPQFVWLEQLLKSQANPCVLAAWHFPLFTSAPRGDNSAMKDIFELLVGYNADLVLQGHEHHFERFEAMLADGTASPAGIESMVVGSGGAALTAFSGAPRPGSVSRIAQFGLLQMTLFPGSASWQFVGLDAGALDSGQITCKRKR